MMTNFQRGDRVRYKGKTVLVGTVSEAGEVYGRRLTATGRRHGPTLVIPAHEVAGIRPCEG